MQQFKSNNYSNILNDNIEFESGTIQLIDHLGGFDSNNRNLILDQLDNKNIKNKIETMYMPAGLKHEYPTLDISFSADLQNNNNLKHFTKYNIHPRNDFNNFICSFNGSDHVSRKLLVSILEKFGYYSPEYCSKNFTYSTGVLDGHISDYLPDQTRLYRKFFISADSEGFFQTTNSFGHVQYAHHKNIYNLENKLTESFLHIVSETMATSYVPFVTEKFLYSIVTRGLFLSYAQPGWHAHLEKYYGFKLYTKLFDYGFDSIQNPVERLVALLTMVSKYRTLTKDDWRDLYLMEHDAIEYNYDHYFSNRYLTHLKQYE